MHGVTVCPHRGMRLSHGFVRGETLACIYHGWRYGTNGVCKHIPAHPSLVPPETIAAKSFHVRDVGGVIWGTAEHAPGNLPHVGSYHPLRSVPVERVETAVRALLGGNSGSPVISDDLALLVQPMGDADCMVHALTQEGSDVKAASAQLEALRRKLEAAP